MFDADGGLGRGLFSSETATASITLKPKKVTLEAIAPRTQVEDSSEHPRCGQADQGLEREPSSWEFFHPHGTGRYRVG